MHFLQFNGSYFYNNCVKYEAVSVVLVILWSEIICTWSYSHIPSTH